MNRISVALVLAGASLALAPAAANAAPRHRAPVAAGAVSAPPLTVRPRSYLDPGNLAPVGSETQYVWVIDRPRNDLPDEGGQAWRYGDQTLPGPFTAPGRQEPLVQF